MINPIDGLPEINPQDILPGDEIVWTWESHQLNNARYYVHTIVPLINGKTEREIKKQEDEFNMIITRDRTFYLVARAESAEDEVSVD